MVSSTRRLAPVLNHAGTRVAAAIALAEQAGAARTVQQGIPVGWRNVPSQPQRTEFEDGTVVEWWRGRDGYVVDGVTVVAASPTSVTLEADGVRTTYDVTHHRRRRRRGRPDRSRPPDAEAPLHRPGRRGGSGSLLAPMPGTVVSVAVEKGAEVDAPARPCWCSRR